MACTIANPLGIAIGSIVVPVIATSSDQLGNALLVTAIIATIAFLPTPFLPSMPPTPPGPRQVDDTLLSADFTGNVKAALRVRPFLGLVYTFGIMVGVFSAISTLLNNAVVPYGYTNDQAGILGALMILGGLIGAAITSPIMDRTGLHLIILSCVLPFALGAFIGLILAIRVNDYAGLCVVSFILGATTFSLLPVGLELGAELTYPIPEAISASILWMVGQFLGLVIQLIMNVLRAGPNDPVPYNLQTGLIFAAALAGSVAIAGSFVARSGKLRRRQAEQEATIRAATPPNVVTL